MPPAGTQPQADAPSHVRTRQHILGRPDCPPECIRELNSANELTRRIAAIVLAAHRSRARSSFIIENPADRGDESMVGVYDADYADHGPMWLLPVMRDLRAKTNARSSTFAMCMLGAPAQKYTTIWYSPDLTELDPLDSLRCIHTADEHVARIEGRGGDGTWTSASHSAWPKKLCEVIARSIARARPLPSTARAPIGDVEHETQRTEAAAPSPPPAATDAGALPRRLDPAFRRVGDANARRTVAFADDEPGDGDHRPLRRSARISRAEPAPNQWYEPPSPHSPAGGGTNSIAE